MSQSPMKRSRIEHRVNTIRETQYNSDEMSILKVPKDVIGDMMYKYLTPRDIKNCLLTNSHFHALSERQHRLTTKLCNTSMFGAVSSNDMELFYHIIRIHDLTNKNPMCFRIDMLLSMCVDNMNTEVISYLFKNFQIETDTGYFGRLFVESSDTPCFRDPDNIVLFMLIEYTRSIDVEMQTLMFTQYRGTQKYPVLPEVLQNCVNHNRVSTLDKLRTEYDINIPAHLIRHSKSDEMTAYIRRHGIINF
jgi:hypothetical protein